MEVDLRAVESAVAFIDLKAALSELVDQDLFQVSFRFVPDVDIAHVIIRACGEFCGVGQAEGAVDLRRNVHDIADLGGNLILGDEDVRIVLAELLDTEHSVQLTGLLLAMDDVNLRDAERQILIGTILGLVDFDGIRAVHGL